MYLMVLIEGVHEMQQRNDHSTINKLHNITVLYAPKFQYMADARGLKSNLQINHWPLNLL